MKPTVKTKRGKVSSTKRADHRTRFKKGHTGYLGDRNPTWMGDLATYEAIHQWLYRHYGKADRCENAWCVYPRKNKAKKVVSAPKTYHWALLKGKQYQHIRENFVRLCPSCHMSYDHHEKEIKLK